MSKSAALDYAAEGIRVNVVAPGIIQTAMMGRVFETGDEGHRIVVDSEPVGRPGRPEEIAAAVLYLCSGEAAFTTGSVLIVDGGQTTWERSSASDSWRWRDVSQSGATAPDCETPMTS